MRAEPGRSAGAWDAEMREIRIDTLGADQTIRGWLPRAKCSRCGSTAISTLLAPEVTPPFKP